MARTGSIQFSVDALLGRLPHLGAEGITEVYVTDGQFSRDRGAMLRLLDALGQLDDPPFVSLRADASAIDAPLCQKAAQLPVSLEVPVRAAEGTGQCVPDKKLLSKKAALLNQSGVVFGLELDWAFAGGDRARLFRDRLCLALSLMPNHVDFAPLDGQPARATAVFSAQDIRLCERIAFACQTFYSEGRAVPWFLSALSPLRISADVFFCDFAEWQECNNCGMESGFSPFDVPHQQLERMQLEFLEQKYAEKRQLMLFAAVRDMVRLNGAFSRLAAEQTEETLLLSYSPDDLLSPFALDVAAFADSVAMEQCSVRVYDHDGEPDYQVL